MPAADKKIVNRPIATCADVSVFAAPSAAEATSPSPRAMPLSAPVMRALPCLRGSNFSPEELKAIQLERNPPAIPATTDAMIAAVESTKIL